MVRFVILEEGVVRMIVESSSARECWREVYHVLRQFPGGVFDVQVERPDRPCGQHVVRVIEVQV